MTEDYPDWTKGVSVYVDIDSPPQYWSGKTKSYEDTSFTESNSPRTLNVLTDLGRYAHDGYIVNNGGGNIKIEIKDPNEGWGSVHTLKANEVVNLFMFNIEQIRLTWVANCGYRIMVV